MNLPILTESQIALASIMKGKTILELATRLMFVEIAMVLLQKQGSIYSKIVEQYSTTIVTLFLNTDMFRTNPYLKKGGRKKQSII